MNKHVNPITAAKAAANTQKPLSKEEQRDLLIRSAQQKLGAIAEGVIYNICHSPLLVNDQNNGFALPPAVVVSYAFNVAEAYCEKMYGVTFHQKDEAKEEQK